MFMYDLLDAQYDVVKVFMKLSLLILFLCRKINVNQAG